MSHAALMPWDPPVRHATATSSQRRRLALCSEDELYSHFTVTFTAALRNMRQTYAVDDHEFAHFVHALSPYLDYHSGAARRLCSWQSYG